MSCNNCTNPCEDPCNSSCRGAKYGCDFQILASPFDESVWNVTICGATTRVKIPKLSETDTKLSTSYGSKSLIYNAEKHTDIITGDQLGGLINLEDIRNVDVANADNCDLFVYNPSCSECGEGCEPKTAKWTKYHIPDAGDCELELDEDGYYKVLIKDDCGCIKECRLPVMPEGMTTIDYVRDSVPDDPDFPWYYGIYNDRINLHLAENAAKWFGKFDLKLTIEYGIQVIKSSVSPNTNFRSLVVPVIAGGNIDVSHKASILQGFAINSVSAPEIPWGSMSMRGSITFVVPKGEEAYLHHEFRLRSNSSFPNYLTNPRDGQKVPDSELGLDTILHTASRLNALSVTIEPTSGSSTTEPVKDTDRSQLDAAVDEYPNPY